MSITAIVEQNTIRLPPGVAWTDGTQVRVEPLAAASAPTFADRYAGFIGAVKDAPRDLAENHDHSLYGTPKRNL